MPQKKANKKQTPAKKAGVSSEKKVKGKPSKKQKVLKEIEEKKQVKKQTLKGKDRTPAQKAADKKRSQLAQQRLRDKAGHYLGVTKAKEILKIQNFYADSGINYTPQEINEMIDTGKITELTETFTFWQQDAARELQRKLENSPDAKCFYKGFGRGPIKEISKTEIVQHIQDLGNLTYYSLQDMEDNDDVEDGDSPLVQIPMKFTRPAGGSVDVYTKVHVDLNDITINGIDEDFFWSYFQKNRKKYGLLL